MADELSPFGSILCKVEEGIRRRIAPNESGCWLWTGPTFAGTGYGVISTPTKVWKAHRYIWTLVKGSIPAGLHCLHKCDIPNCVNPDHLFLGTNRDNHRDKAAKGRHWQQKKTHCPHGHPYSEENTYRAPNGNRKCRLCISARRSK